MLETMVYILCCIFFGLIFKIYRVRDIPWPECWFAICIILMVIATVANWKLLSYLKKSHYEKWEEITTIPGLGPGNHNGFRAMKFLKSKDTLNDPVLEKLIGECKSILLLTIMQYFMPLLLLPLSVILDFF